MEDKHARFLRVAEGRVNKILELIRLLKNCANRGNYEYTDEEVEQIFSAINLALKDARAAYTPVNKKEQSTTFTFK